MNAYLIIAALVWSIALGSGSFFYGKHVQSAEDQAAQLDAAQKAEAIRDKKNDAALNTGVKVEAAQDKVETTFRGIRGNYEIEQRKNPAIGCVLDPVSLRIWNAANTKPDGAATSEPADRVRPVADPAAGTKRSE